MYLPPGHPIMSFETIEIKMAAVSTKRSITSSPMAIAMDLHTAHITYSLIAVYNSFSGVRLDVSL